MSRERGGGVALVAGFSLDQLLWSPRTLALVLVAALPAALVLVFRAALAAGLEMPFAGFGCFSLVTATVGFQFVVPLVALVYAGGLVAEEVEAGTLTYLITRPRRRAALLGGKMLGSLALQAALFVPSIVLSYYLALAPEGWRAVGEHFPALGRDVLAGLLGLAAYSGVFVAAGTALRRPTLLGLGFVFGWEAVVTYIPGFLRQLTVAHYMHSLLPHGSFAGPLANFLAERGSPASAALTLILLAGVAHGLALWLFSRKEYPLRSG